MQRRLGEFAVAHGSVVKFGQSIMMMQFRLQNKKKRLSLLAQRAKKRNKPKGIYNLPEGVLLHITSFMEDTSKVLLVVALSASSDKIRKSNYDIKPCSMGRSILGGLTHLLGRKSCVDFETEKDLAARLSDEDVGGILSCLTNLVNITGKCLVSLYGSADKLRTLDLSLVARKMKGSDDQPDSKLSKIDVIPILDRLLDLEIVPSFTSSSQKSGVKKEAKCWLDF
jgi:hypothetical protein